MACIFSVVTCIVGVFVIVISWAAARMAGIVDAEQAALHSPATGEGK